MTLAPKLQKRVQRYGWDLAAAGYEPLWRPQLASAHSALLACAALAPGERVLDVACGTGLIAFAAVQAVGPDGRVAGVDLSDQMVDAARRSAQSQQLSNVTFARMDAEMLTLPDASFDVALCAFGLMYMPDPLQALREMRRVLRPGGRMVIAVWGNQSRCGWSPLFPIVHEEVVSEVCPLFFHLGQQDALARLCTDAGFTVIEQRRIDAQLNYEDADQACDAAFVGGPVALAWSRFDAAARARLRDRYLAAIEVWRHAEDPREGYRVPGEFVIVSAIAPSHVRADYPSND